MPMSKEEYENLLNELNNPELEHSRRTEVLQALRTDYTGVLTDFEEFSTKVNKLEDANKELTLANSKLFRQAGIYDDPDLSKKEEEKQFSETVTLEQLEQNI